MKVNLDAVRAAAQTIGPHVLRTPLVHSRTLSAIFGAELYLKLENLQYTASFKERGALNRLAALSPAERERGVVAMSAGNHAQAVAYHATRMGIAATIVMPRGTPYVKISNTETLGARVVLEGDTLSEAARHADMLAKRDGRIPIHPYDDPWVIAGQGTVALEMLEQQPALDALIVPVGGGGLIAGCATAAKGLNPDIEIIGVEAELFPAMHHVLAGLPVPKEGFTIAEGIAVKTPGKLTRRLVGRLVSEILLVGEGALERAVQMIAEIEKMVAEGAGAASLAALIAHGERFAGKRVGLVVSGGNIDSRLLATVLMRGLLRSGRLVRVRVEMGDVPGTLARVATLIGRLGGNIVEVDHERWYYDVPVRLTQVDFLIETRGPEEVDTLIAGLNEAGLPARRLRSTAIDNGPL